MDVNAPAEPCECVRLRLQLTERQPRALGVEYFMDSLERLRRRRRLLTSRIAFCAAASTAAGKRGANACADRVPLARRGDAVIWQRVSFVSMRIRRIPRRDNPPRRDLPRRRDLAAAHEQAEPQQRNRRFLCVWEVSGQPVGLWVGGGIVEAETRFGSRSAQGPKAPNCRAPVQHARMHLGPCSRARSM